MFATFVNKQKRQYNKINSIAYGIQAWIRSLPKYSREFTKIYTDGNVEKLDKEMIRVRKEILRFDINPRELLFEYIPQIVQLDLFHTYEFLAEMKAILENSMEELKTYLTEKTKNIFMPNYSGSMCAAINTWYKALNEKTKLHLFDNIVYQMMSYIKNLDTYEEAKVLSELTNLFTMLDMSDWNDDTVDEYLEKIQSAVSIVNKYNNNVSGIHTVTEDCILSIKVNGTIREAAVDNKEISPLGQTALNGIESIFDDYGDAIPNNEKVKILMKALQNFVD